MVDWRFAIVWMALLAGAAAGVADEPAGTLVLDESAYWRYHVRFGIDRIDARALKAEGEKTLGRAGLTRLEKAVKRWSRPPFVEPGQAKDFRDADWRDDAPFFVTQVANCGCNDERVSFHTRSDPPPADWMKADFADGAWPRRRLPLLVGDIPTRGLGHGVGEMKQPGVRTAQFRARFEVADPKAGRYTLSARFRGGVRVFVNGREIARAGLPDGPVGPDAPATGYGADAYVCRDGETAPWFTTRMARRIGAGFVPYCPDLVGRPETIFVTVRGRKVEHYRRIISRKGWDRVRALRDRTIGPVAIPADALVKGTNILAVEVRAARLHPIVAAARSMDWGTSFWMGADFSWAHGRLLSLALRSSDAKAPSALARPAGVHVWVEDPNHRLYAPDFGRSRAGQTLAIVGAIGGTHAGQLAVGTDRNLTALTAVAGPLRAEKGGGEIPASAVRIAWPVGHPASEMVALGQWRGLPEIVSNPVCSTSWMGLLRHGPPAVRAKALPKDEVDRCIGQLMFFDHLGSAPPRRVPAGACQPIWVSLRVPTDAQPGIYRGSIRVRATGIEPIDVPIRAEVLDFRLPDPRHFQGFFAGEQCPYGVAEHYKAPLWSDRHFQLMEPSFGQLARLGSGWVFVPVIRVTEFGNLNDSMVRWVRDGRGALAFDFSILDRYLDLAVKHLGRPAVICFVVSHGTSAGAPATVHVLNQATGKVETLDLSKRSPTYRRDWGEFATAVWEHMKAKGLADALHWGFGWDGIGDPDLIPVLSEAVPEAVRWARGSHAPSRVPGGWGSAFVASSFIYSIGIDETSREGWRHPNLFLLNPRSGCSVVSAHGHSPPFAYRMLIGRALAAGCRGIARIGADYWNGTFYRGYDGRAWPGALPGMGCLSLLWPGPDGAEPSQRGEMFLEGAQEAEARIFLEQAVRRAGLLPAMAAAARNAVARDHRDTLYVPVGRIGVQITEYAGDWQARCRRLYRAAAQVARAVGMDVGRPEVTRSIPARSRGRVELTLRNWTHVPRTWTIKSNADWLTPARAGGTLTAHETLRLDADTARLKPGADAIATVTVTDTAAGRAHRVKVTVRVGPVLAFAAPKAYDYLGAPAHASSWGPRRIADRATFNVPAGGSRTRRFLLINHSGSPVDFRIDSPAAWLKVSPASGRLPGGKRTVIDVTASPADKAAVTHDLSLAVTEPGGTARQTGRMVVHVIPPYAAPAMPPGKAVPLATVPKERVKSHKSRAYWYGTSLRSRDDYGPKFDEQGHITGGTPQVTVYDIAGAGFTAFSAAVRVGAGRRHVRESPNGKKVNFEVWVDGKLRAQSGLMTAADAPRLLVADRLAGAKQLRLIVRWDRPEPEHLGSTVGVSWLAPRFHKK